MISNMELSKTRKAILLPLLFIIHLNFVEGSQILYRHHHPTVLTDKAALLSFKNTIVHDPQIILENWQESSDVCNFTGVLCNRRRHRVVELRLNSTGIQGPLSPLLANLTNLLFLDLSNNQLSGHIPPEFSSLRRLLVLLLFQNQIHGRIPDSLGLLPMLYFLDVHHNRLMGQIPASILYNSTSLLYADFSENTLSGKIPSGIRNSPSELQFLNLYFNKLTGMIPISFSNLTELWSFDVADNSLSGELPTGVFSKMTKLNYLHLSNNHLSSHDNNSNLRPFFTSLSNCTELVELEMYGIGLGGQLPSNIHRIAIHLHNLLLQDNRISGMIPPNLADLSNLTLLNLSSNLFNGTIPAEIGLLPKLERLILSNNSLSGMIPSTIGQIISLGLLDLSENRLSGEIPATLGNLGELMELLLQRNELSGGIPSSIGRCKSLNKVDLSYNRLTGRIPHEISGLRNLGVFLNLSHNHLQGPLPLELSKLEDVQEIDLSSNSLEGNIFPQLESCIAVQLINLSHNSFQGKLPESIGRLQNLQALDVSYNTLSGEIPASLNRCTSLTQLNLSYNNFNGSVPVGGVLSNFTFLSFLGNPHLCVSVSTSCEPKSPWRHRHKFLIIVSIISSLSAFFLTICCVIGLKKIKLKKIFPRKSDMSSKSTPDLKLSFPRITYKELSDATEGFDEGRLIGSGSFGYVYRGVFRDGSVVAVKVLNLQTNNSTKSFNRECQVLKRIRHRNLMRIVTACSLPDFKALVLPFMANGSLESHLYPPSVPTVSGSASSDLNLIQRVCICSDIAEGMAYLHHHSPVKVIHCDLKPSNVLLNDDMTALVSDFGIAKLVMNAGGNGGLENMGNSTANVLCGSIGYIAPEYGFGSNTSTKGDVYSFGILVLEMVTRKRPTDEMFVGGLNLNKWVKGHFQGRVEKVIDPSLMRAARNQSPEVKKMWEVASSELIELGLLCTQEAPSTRPTMLDTADDLDRLKRYLTGDTSATFASSLGISSSTVLGED